MAGLWDHVKEETATSQKVLRHSRALHYTDTINEIESAVEIILCQEK